MTVGQLIECLVGKVAALEGQEIDGTAFSKFDIDDIKERLKGLGFEENGYEYMYNGMTGKKLQLPIFIGPTYYQRLKHMVADKIHCSIYGTEVLTLDGWKVGQNITLNDKVATLDNGVLKYENPIAVLKYPDYEGPMYHIENQAIDLTVTGNHRMWASELKNDKWSEYKFIQASDVYEKDVKYLNLDGEIIINHNDENTIEELKSYKCPVFCLQVPSEVFYVRINGKAVWTGNSRARGPQTILTRQICCLCT